MAKNTNNEYSLEELSNSIADSAAKKLNLPSGSIDLAVSKELKRLIPVLEETNSILSSIENNTKSQQTNLSVEQKPNLSTNSEISKKLFTDPKNYGKMGVIFQGLQALMGKAAPNIIPKTLKDEITPEKQQINLKNQSQTQSIFSNPANNIAGSTAAIAPKSELEEIDKPKKVEIVNFAELAKILPEALKDFFNKSNLGSGGDGNSRNSPNTPNNGGGGGGLDFGDIANWGMAGMGASKAWKGAKWLGKVGKGGIAKTLAAGAGLFGAKKLLEKTGTETAVKQAEETALKQAEQTAVKQAEETAVKQAEQTAVKQAEETAVKQAEQTAVKQGEKAVVQQGEKVAVQQAEKAVVKQVGTEVGTKAASEVAEKAALKVLEEGAEKGIKAKIATALAKRIPKALGGAVAKSVPFLGWAIGAGFAIPRLLKGEYTEAAMEVGSSVGSAATAIPVTVALLAKDVYKDVYGVAPEKDPQVGERMETIKNSVADAAAEFLGKEKKPQEPKISTEKTPASSPSVVPTNIKEATSSAVIDNPKTEYGNNLPEGKENKQRVIPPPIIPPSVKNAAAPETVSKPLYSGASFESEDKKDDKQLKYPNSGAKSENYIKEVLEWSKQQKPGESFPLGSIDAAKLPELIEGLSEEQKTSVNNLAKRLRNSSADLLLQKLLKDNIKSGKNNKPSAQTSAAPVTAPEPVKQATTPEIPAIVPEPVKKAAAPETVSKPSYSGASFEDEPKKEEKSGATKVTERANKQKEIIEGFIKKGYRTLNDIPKEELEAYTKEFAPKSMPGAKGKEFVHNFLAIQLRGQGAKADTGSNNNVVEQGGKTATAVDGSVQSTQPKTSPVTPSEQSKAPAIVPEPVKEAASSTEPAKSSSMPTRAGAIAKQEEIKQGEAKKWPSVGAKSPDLIKEILEYVDGKKPGEHFWGTPSGSIDVTKIPALIDKLTKEDKEAVNVAVKNTNNNAGLMVLGKKVQNILDGKSATTEAKPLPASDTKSSSATSIEKQLAEMVEKSSAQPSPAPVDIGSINFAGLPEITNKKPIKKIVPGSMGPGSPSQDFFQPPIITPEPAREPLQPKAEYPTIKQETFPAGSSKTENILEKIANNTGSSDEKLRNLIEGFNNLARVLEKTTGEKIPTIINQRQQKQSTRLSDYTGNGNPIINNFRVKTVEGSRFQAV